MATVDEEIDRLGGLSTFELRTLWRRQWKQPPPMRLSKDMLIRGLAWKLQEAAFGGIGKPELRRLPVLAKAVGEQRVAASIGGAGVTGLVGRNRIASSTRSPAEADYQKPRMIHIRRRQKVAQRRGGKIRQIPPPAASLMTARQNRTTQATENKAQFAACRERLKTVWKIKKPG